VKTHFITLDQKMTVDFFAQAIFLLIHNRFVEMDATGDLVENQSTSCAGLQPHLAPESDSDLLWMGSGRQKFDMSVELAQVGFESKRQSSDIPVDRQTGGCRKRPAGFRLRRGVGV
jgi:hypothetical protein